MWTKARIYATSVKGKHVCAVKFVQMYTLVDVDGSAYIRGFSKEKARMCNKICTEVYAGLCG